jgi:tRNA(adenine34) deaminase
MDEALAVAEQGLALGELPIGAVVVVDGELVGRAFTQELTLRRLLVHAELLALDQADRVLRGRRSRATLYTTLEPCLMCLGAAASAMVARVVFNLDSPADGAAEFATRWDVERTGDLPHVRLPMTTGGLHTERARDLFRSFVSAHPDDDPRVRWAVTLLRDG